MDSDTWTFHLRSSASCHFKTSGWIQKFFYYLISVHCRCSSLFFQQVAFRCEATAGGDTTTRSRCPSWRRCCGGSAWTRCTKPSPSFWTRWLNSRDHRGYRGHLHMTVYTAQISIQCGRMYQSQAHPSNQSENFNPFCLIKFNSFLFTVIS